MSTGSDDIEVSVIVLNYNGRQWLEDCLTATLAQMNDREELILVDNASTDDSVELVRVRFPAVRLLALDQNVGFARGNNVGAGIARGRYHRIPEQRHHSSTRMAGRLESALRSRSIGRRDDIQNRVSPRSVRRR